MKRFIRPVVFALLAALAPPLTLYASEALRVDSCLDRGGSYDYQLGRCDFAQVHARVPFSGRHPDILLFSAAAGAIVLLLSMRLGRDARRARAADAGA
jgi:hypothetical protein